MLCISAKRSMTHAQSARRLLSAAGIDAQVVSLDGGITKKGCAYGVSFPCSQMEKARRIMASYGLDYGEIIGRR